MVAKRCIKDALKNLCRANFLRTSRKNSINLNEYDFGHHGLSVRKNMLNSLVNGRMDLLHAKSQSEALSCLTKGFNALTLNDFDETIAVLNKEKEESSETIDLYEIVDNQNFFFQNYLRDRRKFWKNFMFNPSQIAVDENAQDNSAVIKVSWEDFEDKKSTEVELEKVRLMDENQVAIPDSKKIFHSTILPNNGARAVLLDAFRYRQFGTPKTSRMALHLKLAPIALGLRINQDSDDDVTNIRILELARYVELLMIGENIGIIKCEDLQTPDDLGIPFVIVIDESCLEKGVIQVRDRETKWHEQIHLAYITPRMAMTFQDRVIPDTYYSVRKRFNLLPRDFKPPQKFK